MTVRTRSRHTTPSAASVGQLRSGRTGASSDRNGSGIGAPRRVVRCAIYTRKSSEEGLEQAFNSLDAQREACEAYVRSQQHEGWMVLPALYDDGGFSGGTMERPALKRLLADIRAGNVDVVVVYKIDRLTRSLFDFAKIVETFDAAQASFVSITQSFNTTTSMGRLTLNVLLSFAQFEREVTGERIRDKIAASKRKGMWMGGNVPFGYDLANRKLVVNEREAATVRTIFQLYLEHGTVRAVKQELDRRGLRTKARGGAEDAGTSRPSHDATLPADGAARNGRERPKCGSTSATSIPPRSARAVGGQFFGIGHLFTVLRNPLYVGMVRHKGELHLGEHEAIIPKFLWRRVQRKLNTNAVDRMTGHGTKVPSLLTGRIMDEEGNRLTPSHAAKGAKRYRYYVSGGRDLATDGTLRIPAPDVEAIVVHAVRDLLVEPHRIADALGDAAGADVAPGTLGPAIERGATLAARLGDPSDADTAAIVRRLVTRVTVSPTQARIAVDRARLADALLSEGGKGADRRGEDDDAMDDDGLNDFGSDDAAFDDETAADGADELPIDALVIERELVLCRQRKRQRLILAAPVEPDAAKPDPTLIKAIVRARSWFAMLRERRADSIAELGRREDVARAIISHHLPLAFLAPDLTESILEGRQPVTMTLDRLIAIAAAAPAWDRQRTMFQSG
jgi:site-specific DNA recombinase